jgi:hypothetical protein
LKYEFAKHLKPSDMPIAMSWVEETGRRALRLDPIEALKDEIMLKAWEYLYSPGVLHAFASAAISRIKHFDRIVRDDRKGSFQQKIEEDGRKRHQLLNAIIQVIAEKGAELSRIVHGDTRLVLDEDLAWIIEQLEAGSSDDIRHTWAKFLKATFRWGGNPEQVKAILCSCQSIPILAEVFDDLLKPVALDSEEAKALKKTYQMMMEAKERMHPTLTPPPSERVASLLEEFEAGNLAAWWRLNMEMTLEPDSTHYGPEHETAIQKLPGWKAADQMIRGRILNAARLYILEGDPQESEWLGEAVIFRPAVSGVRAFRLIADKDPEFIENLQPEIWKKWAPAIVASLWPDDADDEDALKILVKKAYVHAPDEVLNALTIMVGKEDRQYGNIFIIERMESCWDSRLEKAILLMVKEANLKAESVGVLTRELVRHRSREAYGYIRSLLNQTTPEGERSDPAFFAAGALLEDAEANWPAVWPVIQEDEKFGRKVLESVSYIGRRAEDMFGSLTERQLAELYVWLSCKYPHEEDPQFDKGHSVGARESIGHWRDDVLRSLKLRGTIEACDAIRWIMEGLPHLEWLKWTLLDARAVTRQNTWNPPEPINILDVAKSAELRLVQDGEQLLDAVVESLNRLQAKIQGETPSVVFLWDEVGKGKFKPKDEGRLSDYIKNHLYEDLKERGIIVNREVEVRRIAGQGIGERTDIHVDAVINKPDGHVYDQITVVIESKGCWNKELGTAMETQLVGQYLDQAKCRHGLYLVGWYLCALWTNDDERKKRAPEISIDNARELFEKQAAQLSTGGRVVRAFVMDTALKRKYTLENKQKARMNSAVRTLPGDEGES